MLAPEAGELGCGRVAVGRPERPRQIVGVVVERLDDRIGRRAAEGDRPHRLHRQERVLGEEPTERQAELDRGHDLGLGGDRRGATLRADPARGRGTDRRGRDE